MKKLLLLPFILLLSLSACKKDGNEPVPDTVINLEVMKQKKSSSGTITAEPESAIIYMWNAEDREFDVAASPDIQYGAAYDRVNDTSVTMKYGAIGSRMKEKIIPGRYFIYVVLPKSSKSGSLAYSYTYIDIKEGETLNLTKTFSHDLGAGMYEEWSKNK